MIGLLGTHVRWGAAAVLAVCCALVVNAGRAADQPGSIRVSWTENPVEDSIASIVQATKGELSILCDSYVSDGLEVSRGEVIGKPHEVLEQLARAYRRQLLRRGSVYLVRHLQWFDPQSAGLLGDAKAGRHKQTLSLTPTRSKGDLRLKLDCRHIPLNSLASRLGEVTTEPHFVALALRTRRVSGLAAEVTPGDLRESITTLFPDTTWHRRGTNWYLVERPTAELTRLMAKEGASHANRARAALYTQVAADLTPEQLERLRNTGEVQVGWEQMSPTNQDLLVRWADQMKAMIARSDGRTDLFLDYFKKDQWGVEFVTRPNGHIHPRSYGQSMAGPRAIY